MSATSSLNTLRALFLGPNVTILDSPEELMTTYITPLLGHASNLELYAKLSSLSVSDILSSRNALVLSLVDPRKRKRIHIMNNIIHRVQLLPALQVTDNLNLL